ncbi:MAG: NADH-quinone oxidoreductase subunit H [Anaerolineae bacterium]|nr:NADH-quinone oxidoreductase subunit H [Anaerolineae bacterium]
MRQLLKTLFALFVFPGFSFLFLCAMVFDWLDRRIIARFQGRVGPPWYQPLADFIKLMAKEDILPVGSGHTIAALLPMVSLAAVLTAGIYVPFAGASSAAFEGDLIVVLFLLSIPSVAYFLAGWVTVGVYSVLGGNRALLQYFSYEVPFLMALSAPAILSGSWSIASISARQTMWGVFVQPLGFILATVGLIGKLKRDPLDIPKAKSEVVAGSLTEYSGRKLALWHLSMEMQTVVGIYLLVNLYLGGSRTTFVVVPTLLAHVIFYVKALGILGLLSTASVLFARLRIDQFADIGWQLLAPLSLLQIMVTIWLGE